MREWPTSDSRRDFLKTLGIGVAAVAAIPHLASDVLLATPSLYGLDMQMSELFMATADVDLICQFQEQMSASLSESIKLAGRAPCSEMVWTYLPPTMQFDESGNAYGPNAYLTVKQYAI